MKSMMIALGAIGLALPAVPALANPPSWAPAHGYYQHASDKGHHGHAVYDSHGRYYEPRRVTRRDKIWRGKDGRYYCKRSNGTTGLIIGAAGGALVGRAIDTRGDRTVGTVLGAVAGGLLGREIDRGEARCR